MQLKEIIGKIAYITFIVMLLIVGFLSGKLHLKATTINYNYNQYYLRYQDLSIGYDNYWTQVGNFGTWFDSNNQGINLNSIRVRLGFNSNFQANTKYRLKVNFRYRNTNNGKWYYKPYNVICQGSATSQWSSDEGLIDTCKYVGKSLYNDNNNASYLFDITPNSNVYGLQLAFYFQSNETPLMFYNQIGGINVLSSTSISYDSSTSDSINSSTTEIINNNESNTERIIESQKELLAEKCPNLFGNVRVLNGWLQEDGSIMMLNLGGNNRIAIIPAEANTTYTITRKVKTGTFRVSSYNGSSVPTMTNSDVSYNVQSVTTNNSGDKITYTTNSSAKWLLIMFGHVNNDSSTIADSYASIMVVKGSNSIPFCEFGSYQSKLDTTNNAINEVNDTIKDDDVDNPGSFIDDMNDMLPTNGTITSLIALPITLYQKIITNLNGTCNSMNLGSLYGTNLIMPCIEVSNYLGNSLWTIIDLIISGVFVLTIARKMIKAFEGFTGMKEGDVIND